MLEIQEISMIFGGLVALDAVSMTVNKGSIRGLIGPNGSGKTTLINVITGFYAPTKGRVLFEGKTISGRQPFAVAKYGLCRTFQNINLFSDMTVQENVITPQITMPGSNIGSAIFQTQRFREQEKQVRERAAEILEFVGLGDKQDIKAKNLPYGLQRRLEIARALATEPKLLLLDEPVAGMNEQESAEVAELVCKLRDQGMTILLIEHHMRFVMNLCDELTVLNAGAVNAEGTPTDIQNNEKVVECYLGKKRSK